jgi:hypothetical protein
VHLRRAIMAVVRPQNPRIYRQYEMKAAELLKSQPHDEADVRVYHGSGHNPPNLIVKNGFDVSFGRAKPG